jgi:3-hydroxyisobutyrate dehydrogenase-like beta-hydroxyacid dehydrogenase
VIAECDITFSCVADPQVAKDMVFGNCGVLSEITTVKGYVEMTGIDADTSQDIAEAINLKGGRYLEAQVQGSKDEAQDGTLVVLVAGDRSLFDDCQSCFQVSILRKLHLGQNFSWQIMFPRCKARISTKTYTQKRSELLTILLHLIAPKSIESHFFTLIG